MLSQLQITVQHNSLRNEHMALCCIIYNIVKYAVHKLFFSVTDTTVKNTFSLVTKVPKPYTDFKILFCKMTHIFHNPNFLKEQLMLKNYFADFHSYHSWIAQIQFGRKSLPKTKTFALSPLNNTLELLFAMKKAPSPSNL